MSVKYLYLIIAVIILTTSSLICKVQTLQEAKPPGKTHFDDTEAIVQDDDDISTETIVFKGKKPESVTPKKSKIEKPAIVSPSVPKSNEETAARAQAHANYKRGEIRRLLDEENFPSRPLVHDSRSLHEFSDMLNFEDQIGAGQWANRWYYETTTSYYRNATIELITLNEYEVRNWVTACPGHHYIKFKVKGHKDAIVYLSEHFSVAQSDNKKVTTSFVKINIGASSSFISSNEEEMKTNYAYHVHPKEKRYVSEDEFRAFWIWWDDNGMILVGRRHKNPFLAYYVNKYQGKRWKVKAVGFGATSRVRKWYSLTTWHINVEFPIHDDAAYEDHSDESSDQDQ